MLAINDGSVSIGVIIEEKINKSNEIEIEVIIALSWLFTKEPIAKPIKVNKEEMAKIVIIKEIKFGRMLRFKKKEATKRIIVICTDTNIKQVIKSPKTKLNPEALLTIFRIYALEVLSLILKMAAKTIDPNNIKKIKKLGKR